MLKIATTTQQIDFSQIKNVYQQSLEEDGDRLYDFLPKYQRLNESEQDFYQYVMYFLKQRGCFYAIWVTEGIYRSAVRVEPYKDGVLLTGLETAPDFRKMGYATALLEQTLGYLKNKSVKTVYSHIDGNNKGSIAVHRKVGFDSILHYATFLDGSASVMAQTFIKRF